MNRFGPVGGINLIYTTLETKSGPIQAMAIHDVTKFYHNDLIVADSCGIMTVFCSQQILCRQSIAESSISSIQVDKDKTGNIVIVMSTEAGVISGVLPSSERWRINLHDLGNNMNPKQTVSVRSLLAAELVNQHGHMSSYIMAADDNKNLIIIHQGTIVAILKTTSIITAMCQGRFVAEDQLLPLGIPSGGGPAISSQVALGSESGAVYIFHNFNVTEDEYANTQYPITNLRALTVPDKDTDLLLCTGHFNSLNVYSDGKKVAQHQTPDWINSLEVADLDGDGTKEVVFGCLDNSVHAVKVSPT
ncbi:hypothetical protein KP79_PYT09512 [Mizuhopecten yessoensis]|uniref:Uncharacterized protein n=1 Tax=Mizuhopecten yessoensis TaxID=6573 RepID=A0A210Q455_MIZYE|nr:hypothetical protein KP79_PYT09512 [Mizuhopecten yessoensis]